MNRLTLSGELIGRPEVKTVGAGYTLCAAVVRVERPARDGEAAKADDVRVEAWNVVGQRLAAIPVGARVIVDGAVRVSSWTSDSGEPRSRQFVSASAVEVLSELPATRTMAAPAATAPANGSRSTAATPRTAPAAVDNANDLPF